MLEERGINVTYVGVTHAIVCHVNLSLKCVYSRCVRCIAVCGARRGAARGAGEGSKTTRATSLPPSRSDVTY